MSLDFMTCCGMKVRKSFLYMPFLKFFGLKYSTCQGAVFWGSRSWTPPQPGPWRTVTSKSWESHEVNWMVTSAYCLERFSRLRKGEPRNSSIVLSWEDKVGSPLRTRQLEFIWQEKREVLRESPLEICRGLPFSWVLISTSKGLEEIELTV